MHTLISFLIGTIYALAGVIIAYLTFCLLIAFVEHTALGIAWGCLALLLTWPVAHLINSAERAHNSHVPVKVTGT